MNTEQAIELLSEVRMRMNSKLIGQDKVVDQVLISMISNGHVLVEGVPGLGKTLLVRLLANCFGGQFKRIQFTPDLMPADITGHVLFDSQENKFRIRKGPVFTNILLADEINRSPAKTQSALLEVMQERQVTLEGNTQMLPKPFLVIATQNPIEQEGTYPLPEAELDRFLMKVFIDYPSEENEIRLTQMVGTSISDDPFVAESPLMTPEQIADIQEHVVSIQMDESVLEYAVKLVRVTRNSAAIQRGAGTRACIALVKCAKAFALMQGRTFVLPDDVKAMATPVMRHRILLSAEVEIEGTNPDQVLAQIFHIVEAPRV